MAKGIKGSGPVDRKYLDKVYAFKAKMQKSKKRG